MTTELSQVLQDGPGERKEFLSARTSLEAIGRVVCALLNQQGGLVLWGVDSKGRVAGIRHADDRERQLNEYLSRHLNPRPLFSVSTVVSRPNPVIVVDVTPGGDKPYSCNGEIWVRLGRKSFRADIEQSATIVQDAAAAMSRWERSVVPGFEVADCDKSELGVARAEIERSGRFGADVPADDEALLRTLLLEKNGQLTNAAMVLFAARPQQWAPNLSVRVLSYGRDAGDVIGNETSVVGPAVHVLKEVVALVQQRTGFSSRFHPARLSRDDRPAYPVFALREGLVNALAHRDYAAVGGQVRVDVFPERLVISNPGSLPPHLSPGDLLKEHKSDPRNPDIARVFYLREFMERLGRGTLRLAEACRKVGAKKPMWEVRQGSVWLTLFKAPEPDERPELPDRQRRFLAALPAGERFSVSDYVQATGASERQSRRDLSQLESAGLIARFGRGRATTYEIRRE